MISLKLFAILILAVHDVYGRCSGDKWCCTGQCGQGEGDCDEHSNCLPGLICDYDGWFGTDYCKAGPDTKDFSWSDWGEWSECSVACGGVGSQSRVRSCIPPTNGGYECPSDTDSESQDCNNGPCPVNGGWGEWPEWESCSVSCGGGEQSRFRSCDSPAPEYGGDDCTIDGSESSEIQSCNENPCPINGGWGEWLDWEVCSVSCGGGEQTRLRSCDNPAPEHGGDDCSVDGSSNSETQNCNENPCPIDGGLSEWDEWGACTEPCGGGDQTRSRRCDNPAPEFGGLDCVGELTECQRCNLEPCASHCPA